MTKIYEYKDTFIKRCTSVDGVGECERSRETVKCIDNKCTKVQNPNNKKAILEEHYNSLQTGAGPDPELQSILHSKLKEKYRCPVEGCGEYKYMGSLLSHIKKHSDKLPPKKRLKFQTGGCAGCMFGGCAGCMFGAGDAKHPCPYCHKSKSVQTILKHVKKNHIDETKKQTGGGKDKNEVKEQLLHNIKNKYRCPLCHKYKFLDRMQNHMRKYHIIAPNNTPVKELPDDVTLMENTVRLSQQGSGKIRSQFYGKKSSVMVKVPENVKKTAQYSLKLHKLGFKGGLETGFKRAKQLATKESIPIEDLRYMRAWFSRHIYASYPSYRSWIKDGRPKNEKKWFNKHGILSWLIWGGTEAFNWVNTMKNIKLLNVHFNKNYTKLKLPKN
jgi:hypothetical protein